MSKLISLLLVATCLVCFASCKSNKNVPDYSQVTPTSAQQEGTVTPDSNENLQGTQDSEGQNQISTPTPDVSGDVGNDLEEDILGSDDEPQKTDGIIVTTAPPASKTSTPVATATNSGTQNTPTPGNGIQATATPEQSATAKPIPSSVTLPMDWF